MSPLHAHVFVILMGGKHHCHPPVLCYRPVSILEIDVINFMILAVGEPEFVGHLVCHHACKNSCFTVCHCVCRDNYRHHYSNYQVPFHNHIFLMGYTFCSFLMAKIRQIAGIYKGLFLNGDRIFPKDAGENLPGRYIRKKADPMSALFNISINDVFNPLLWPLLRAP